MRKTLKKEEVNNVQIEKQSEVVVSNINHGSEDLNSLLREYYVTKQLIDELTNKLNDTKSKILELNMDTIETSDYVANLKRKVTKEYSVEKFLEQFGFDELIKSCKILSSKVSDKEKLEKCVSSTSEYVVIEIKKKNSD